MTCKDCEHFDACKENIQNFLWKDYTLVCNAFKDKRKIVELPCVLGDDVFIVTKGGFVHQRTFAGVHISTVRSRYGKVMNYIITSNGLSTERFNMKDIGNYIFFSEEKANKKAKEIKEKRV